MGPAVRRSPFKNNLGNAILLLGPIYGAPLAVKLLIDRSLGILEIFFAAIPVLLGALLHKLPMPVKIFLKTVHGILLAAALAAAMVVYSAMGSGERWALLMSALLSAGFMFLLFINTRSRRLPRPQAILLILPCVLPPLRALYFFDVPWFISAALLGLALPVWAGSKRGWSMPAVLGTAWFITMSIVVAAFSSGMDMVRVDKTLNQPGVSALYTYAEQSELSKMMGRGARFIERLPDGDLLAFTTDPGPYMYRLSGDAPHMERAKTQIHASDSVVIWDENKVIMGWGSSPAELDLTSFGARRLADSRPGRINDFTGPVKDHVLYGYDWLYPYFGDYHVETSKARYVELPGRMYNFANDGELAWVSVVSLRDDLNGLYRYDPAKSSLEIKAAGVQGNLRLDRDYAYVIDTFSPDLNKVDRHTGRIVNSIDLAIGTRCLWIDAERDLLVVSGYLDGRLWFIDTSDLGIIRILHTGGRVRWISHDPATDSLFACSNLGGIVIDLKTVLD